MGWYDSDKPIQMSMSPKEFIALTQFYLSKMPLFFIIFIILFLILILICGLLVLVITVLAHAPPLLVVVAGLGVYLFGKRKKLKTQIK